jgi:hypothetical protein
MVDDKFEDLWQEGRHRGLRQMIDANLEFGTDSGDGSEFARSLRCQSREARTSGMTASLQSHGFHSGGESDHSRVELSNTVSITGCRGVRLSFLVRSVAS